MNTLVIVQSTLDMAKRVYTRVSLICIEKRLYFHTIIFRSNRVHPFFVFAHFELALGARGQAVEDLLRQLPEREGHQEQGFAAGRGVLTSKLLHVRESHCGN